VPVLGYKTDKMPIFYTSSPSLKVLYRVDSAAELAQIVNASHALDLQSGILVVNPIPEKDALPYKDVEKVIEEAITEMEKEGIRGKEQTPYLLTKINELTKGKSQIANEALIVNNAKLGAMIAKNISRELYED